MFDISFAEAANTGVVSLPINQQFPICYDKPAFPVLKSLPRT